MNEKEALKDKIKLVVQKMTKGDIANLLQFYFETIETPNMIVISRGNDFIEGFMKVAKVTFKYEIFYWTKDYGIELRLKLKHGRSVIEKRIQVEFKEQENEIMIYQTNDKMYLFSVYF